MYYGGGDIVVGEARRGKGESGTRGGDKRGMGLGIFNFILEKNNHNYT